MGKQSKGGITSLTQKVEETNTKGGLLRKHILPVNAFEYFLASKISTERLGELYVKYFDKPYNEIDKIGDMLSLAGYEIDVLSPEYYQKRLFTAANMFWIEHLLNNYWKKEVDRTWNDLLRSMAENEIISKTEHAKLLKAYKDFRGSKIVTKNRKPYMKIIEACEKSFVKKGLGEQWRNAVALYAKQAKLSETQEIKLYKSFMKWRGVKTLQEMKNLLSESRLRINPR